VTGIRREGEDWYVNVAGAGGDSRLRTRRIVLAAPPAAVAEILRGVNPAAAAELETIEYAPMVSVSVGAPASAFRTPIAGFGFLVPRDAGIRLLGCLFMSQLFPDRAPAGSELLQCMIGGLRWREAVDLPDDVIADQVRSDLDRILGLSGNADVLAITRYQRAVAQPGRDHIRRIDRIRSNLAGEPGLALSGSYVAGVGVPDAFASGVRAAREILTNGSTTGSDGRVAGAI
jgi:oxygen-dependent protoporphyrinogen oxidase